VIKSSSRKKVRDDLTKHDLEQIAAGYLRGYLVDSSETEQRLLQAWLSEYRRHIAVLAAKCD
jgi:hypothetical protein